MHLLSFAKGALAMFWLLALANLFVPLGEAWFWPVNLAAAAVLLAHVGEVLLFRQRLQSRSAALAGTRPGAAVWCAAYPGAAQELSRSGWLPFSR